MADEAPVRIPVLMLWDAKNCPKPERAEDLVRNVNKVIQEFHKSYYIAKIRVSGSEQFISKGYCEQIQDCADVEWTIVPECHNCNDKIQGVRVAGDPYERPNGGAVANLLFEMMKHASEIREDAGKVILVVSGNSDFKWSVEDLVREGYVMLTAVDKDATKSCYSGYDCAWMWDDMKDGVNNKMLWNWNNVKDGVSHI